MIAIALAAALLAAPAVTKPSAAEEAADKAAAAAAQAADAASKAAAAAAQAAESAAKAADRAAAAAEKAAATAEKVAEKPAEKPAEKAPEKAAEKPAEKPAPKWTGTLGLGTIFLTGNTQTITFTSSLALERKSEEWIVGLKAGGAYGQTTLAGTAGGPSTDQVTALSANIQVRGERRFTPIFSGYLQGGILTDHVASIEERPQGEFGGSVLWFDVKEGELAKTSLKTDLGLVAGYEYRQQYYPTVAHLDSVAIVAPHLGVAYKYAASKEIQFSNDLDLSPNVINAVRLILVDSAKITARLSEGINLAIGFKLNWDTLPAAGKKELDTATLISLEIAL
jgi:hypothetical protein